MKEIDRAHALGRSNAPEGVEGTIGGLPESALAMRDLLAALKSDAGGLAELSSRLAENLPCRYVDQLPAAEPATQALAELCREELLRRYCFSRYKGGQVSFSLPRGLSVHNLLTIVQVLAPVIYRRNAVSVGYLDDISRDAIFSCRKGYTERLRIHGIHQRASCAGYGSKVDALCEEGLTLPTADELAAAHALNFLANGTDLFGGNEVKAERSIFSFSSRSGLDEDIEYRRFGRRDPRRGYAISAKGIARPYSPPYIHQVAPLRGYYRDDNQWVRE